MVPEWSWRPQLVFPLVCACCLYLCWWNLIKVNIRSISQMARHPSRSSWMGCWNGEAIWWLSLGMYELQLAAPLPPLAAAHSLWARAPPSWVPRPLGAIFQCGNRGPRAISNISESSGEIIHLPMTGLPRLNEMSFLCCWLAFCRLSLAVLLILGWSGALLGPYMRPWQIKMNYYLINAIGLAKAAFQSMAPWSSKGPNKRASQKGPCWLSQDQV